MIIFTLAFSLLKTVTVAYYYMFIFMYTLSVPGHCAVSGKGGLLYASLPRGFGIVQIVEQWSGTGGG